MKSLWFVLYDIMSIAARRQLKSSSAFCQANGFFFAMGIEAADAAVFLIALHSTVYIFWPHRAGGNSGLYPYRRGAYAFFVLWPISMASLAFVSGTSAYVNTGQYCYLPMKPWWYRTALSWIPRYINLVLILLMYGSSYMYIRVMMRRYSRRDSEIPVGLRTRMTPPTPTLMFHELFPLSLAGSLRSSSRTPSTIRTQKEGSISRPTQQLKTCEPFRGTLDMLYPGTRMEGYQSWAGFESAHSPSHITGPSSAGVTPCGGTAFPGRAAIEPFAEPAHVGEASISVQQPKLALLDRQLPAEMPSSTQSSTAIERSSTKRHHRLLAEHVDDYFNGAAYSGRGREYTGSQVDIQRVLREGPVCLSGMESEKSSSILALDQATFESGGISTSRERLRRQLRYLFVYPAVYLCIWVFPFANDLAIFDQSMQKHPSYWLILCSLISLSIQGLADSLVFFAREKPWRHLRGGFWESLGLDFVKNLKFSLRKDSGRTREEMFNDSQRARFRREEELELENETRDSPEGRRSPAAGDKHWWDADFEGPLSRRSTMCTEAGQSGDRRGSSAKSLPRTMKTVSLSA